MKYMAVFEPTDTGLSVYVPDLPGCISTGTDFDEAERNIREAIQLHLKGIRDDGGPIPEPTSFVRAIEVAS